MATRIPIIFNEQIRAFEIAIDATMGKHGMLKIHNGRELEIFDFAKEAFVSRSLLAFARVFPDRFNATGAPELLEIELSKVAPEKLEDGQMSLDDTRGVLYIGLFDKIAIVRII